MEQSETTMDSSLDVQLYPEERLGLGVQHGTPDRYFYCEANSHKSCVDQENRWVIKFRLDLNLFDLIKSSFVQLCVDASTWSMVTIFRLGCIQVKRKIVTICVWNTS